MVGNTGGGEEGETLVSRNLSVGFGESLNENSDDLLPPLPLSPLSPLLEHLRTHAVRTDGPFALSSGDTSDWYLDARQTTFDGVGARLVGAAVLGVLDPETVAVGGMTMGADPIAIATALVAAENGRLLRAFSVRKTAKAHGVGGRLVGPVRMGDRVTVLEDTTTTGAALLEAIAAAAAAGLLPRQAISLVDRSGGKVAAAVTRQGLSYRALVTPELLGLC